MYVFILSLDKGGYQVNICSYFSTKTYVTGAHQKHLAEDLLMSTDKIVLNFRGEI